MSGFSKVVERYSPLKDVDPNRFKSEASPASHFAWLRTRLSLERTLMAWVRTGVSLIGFGFTIVQFFDRFHSMTGVSVASKPEAPRILGLALIGAGVVAMLISSWQYYWSTEYLRSKQFEPIAGFDDKTIRTPVLYVALLIAAIGIFAFVAVSTRMN